MTLALEVRGLQKSFFGYRVLEGIDLEVSAGEIHGLVGENGAGKSTLMKILAGVYQPDGGSLRVDGVERRFGHPVQATRAGISTVFQEFNLLPERTVAQNVYLAREPRRGPVVLPSDMTRRTRELLESLEIDSVDPDARVGSLSVAEQQIVEIVKALSYDARIIQMDEPTAALAEHEVALLAGIVRRLSQRGVAVLYVSHRLREIFDLCDRVTVLKDGALVTTAKASELDEQQLVRLMVGRTLSSFFPEKPADHATGPATIELRGAGNHAVDDVSLTVHGGEIVGMAGLQGAGRTEVLDGIAGAVPFTRGSVLVDGVPARLSRPRHAVRRHIAYITEDRKATGLMLDQSVLDNTLAVVRAVRPRDARASRAEANRLLTDLELVARGPDQEVRFLSGGNQQKVILAKWLLTKPRVILFDEPTRGIDVGAKYALYRLMRELASAGHAILMVSSELPELIGMADRILVMHEGRMVAELPSGSSEERILAAASGLDDTAVA
jgi:ribose transport system ATP-binding protein